VKGFVRLTTRSCTNLTVSGITFHRVWLMVFYFIAF